MAMMWAGRFSREVDSKVNAFNLSIAFKDTLIKAKRNTISRASFRV